MMASSTVSQQEFRTFHNIDRVLYARLVLNLNRDPVESMHVMAMLLWLEMSGHARYLVHKLLSFPDTLINSLADETLICWTCISCIVCGDDNKCYFSSLDSTNSYKETPLIHSLTKTALSLQFFHENRPKTFHGVTKIFNEVCQRAFDDIAQLVGASSTVENKNVDGAFNVPLLPMVHYNHVGFQRNTLNEETIDLLSRLRISNREADEKECVPADDRTIFLTFSRGYPISEDEVRDFFTRKYGDCIEAIYMQEAMDDQPLYARLVVKSSNVIKVILEGMTKAKFSINGKHAWARKYIRKSPRLSSPPQPSSPSPQPSSSSPEFFAHMVSRSV